LEKSHENESPQNVTGQCDVSLLFIMVRKDLTSQYRAKEREGCELKSCALAMDGRCDNFDL
jgi:hypothetical protein